MAAPNNHPVTVWSPPPKQTLLIPLAAVYTHMSKWLILQSRHFNSLYLNFSWDLENRESNELRFFLYYLIKNKRKAVLDLFTYVG